MQGGADVSLLIANHFHLYVRRELRGHARQLRFDVVNNFDRIRS